MRIVFTAKISERHREEARKRYPGQEFVFCETIEQATDSLSDAEVIITYGNDLTDEIINECRLLEWVQVFSAGVDDMPLKMLAERKIRVTNVRGIHQIPMAEYAMGLMLQDTRQYLTYYENQKENKWDPSVRVDELHGKTLGVVGTGAIGQALAQRARAFGMKTLGANRSGKEAPGFDEVHQVERLNQLLENSDVIVVLVPLTEKTKGLFDKKAFSAMKSSALFINMARGGVVCEEALVQALREGMIRQAVSDVFQQEPLPKSSPLWELPNCLVTPHVSGLSPKYVARSMDIFYENLQRYLSRERSLLNEVGLTRGY